MTRVMMGMHDCGSHSCSAAAGKGEPSGNEQVSGTASQVKLDLTKIGSGSLGREGQRRPTQEERERIAADIRAGGPFADMLEVEKALGQNPNCFCGTPVTDEALAEKAEGGGPIAAAYDEWLQDEKEEVTL